jgi:pimeloyl-ACP methyl ester carboxylesterase
MDEASSKFVDRLVQEKLLDEKLRRVHHFPEDGIDERPAGLFEDFPEFARKPLPETVPTPKGFRFDSPLPGVHPENNSCEVVVHRSPDPTACVVLLHGLFEDSRAIHDFLVRELLKLGCDVFQPTLPYHYDRKPPASLFGGEYFWSANYKRTRTAFKQAVLELHALQRIVRAREGLPALVAGFSMGGCVSLLLASVCEDLHGVFAINPATSLSGIVWDSPLCQTIKADYLAAGVSIERLQGAFSDFEPLGASRVALDRERIRVAYGIYDQVTSVEQYESLVRAWNLRDPIPYKAGHMNTLRMPRLAGDIAQFIRSLPETHPEPHRP